jgi:hypothetical protein
MARACGWSWKLKVCRATVLMRSADCIYYGFIKEGKKRQWFEDNLRGWYWYLWLSLCMSAERRMVMAGTTKATTVNRGVKRIRGVKRKR